MGNKDSIVTESEIFSAIAQKISLIIGVQLGDKQRSLVDSRLSKHLRGLGGMTAEEYWDYFHENEAQEVQALISLLTTHHTFFFREAEQFQHIGEILPELVARAEKEGRKTIEVWSAACSHGHEGYSLAMYLENRMARIKTNVTYRILFSDVDSASVHASSEGVYATSEVSKIPVEFRSNHWITGKGSAAGFSRVSNKIRSKCEFSVKNLLEIRPDRSARKFDLIFCRNVFIYFNAQQIQKIVDSMTTYLRDQGLFFVGSSESLAGLKIPLDHIGKSIYARKREAVGSSRPPRLSKVNSAASATQSPVASESVSQDVPLLIAIGASTGGTDALARILAELPAEMPPIVIVQHIPAGFSRDFSERLNRLSKLEAKEAADGDRLLPGHVLVAPGNRHVEVVKRSGSLRIVLGGSEKISGHCPSIDVMMNSVATLPSIAKIGLILTGMGADGAQGLLAMRKAGARTLGQNEKSSVVYGMPKVAKQLGAVEKEVDLKDIAREIIELVGQFKSESTGRLKKA